MERLIITLLYIYFFLTCISSLFFVFEGYTFMPVLSMVIILLWWGYFCVSEKIQLNKMDIFLALYAFFFMIPLLSHPGTPFDDWLAWGITIQLAFLCVITRTMLNDRKKIQFALVVLLVGLFFLATLTVFNDLGVISLGVGEKKTMVGGESLTRHSSLVGGINRSAFYFAVGILLGCGLLFDAKSFFTKIMLGVIILLCSVAELLTYSVGGLVSLCAGLFILFSRQIFTKRLSFKQIGLISFGILVLGMLIMYNPRIQHQQDQIMEEEFMYWGSSRGAAYLGALKSISDNYLLGVGPTRLIKEIANNHPYSPFSVEFAAHNTFLSIAGESGGAGFLFFMLFLGSMAVVSWRDRRFYRFRLFQVLLACAGMIIVTGLIHDLQRDKFFWIILGLFAATLSLPRGLPRKEGSLGKNPNLLSS